MKRYFYPVIILLASLLSLQSSAQETAIAPQFKTYRVGIFAPLYLDSVFSYAGNFRYKEGMPKFITPAVDFVNGVQIGLDSLKLMYANVEAYIYDTKSYSAPLAGLIKNKKLDNLDLLIGSVRDVEYRQLADFALSKNVPFISAVYPNDGGITANPNVIILNSTLKAHCEAIYSYVLQNHGTDKIFLCRKKGGQEDKIANYFKLMNEQDGKPLLNIQTVNFDSTISINTLKAKFDSNRQSVIIGGSLDERFAMSLANASYSLYAQYPLTLIGMPNWDGFKGLMKEGSFEDFPVYFTTPYFNQKIDDKSRMLIDAYDRRLKGKPNDLAFKGFECVQLFVKMLAAHPTDFMKHLNDKDQKVITDYNFRPVTVSKNATGIDYFENKHVYFIRILNGTMYKAW